jgi:hypothetical protein
MELTQLLVIFVWIPMAAALALKRHHEPEPVPQHVRIRRR